LNQQRCPGTRVTEDGAAALPGAQCTVRLPLELDRVGTAVTLDAATIVGAECFSDRRPDFAVVVADEQPAYPLKALDQLPRKRLKYARRVGHRGRASIGRRSEAREQHQGGKFKRVAQLVVHAHVLVRRPLRCRVHFRGVTPSGGEGLLLSHQAAQPSKDGLDPAGIVQPETANEERTVLGDEGTQRVAVLGCPARWLADGFDVQYRQLSGLQVHVEN